MKVEHKLGPVWAAHLQRMNAEIQAHESEALRLDGMAANQRREADLKRRHASQLMTLITESEKLPASVTPWALSKDATALIGEVKDAAAG